MWVNFSLLMWPLIPTLFLLEIVWDGCKSCLEFLFGCSGDRCSTYRITLSGVLPNSGELSLNDCATLVPSNNPGPLEVIGLETSILVVISSGIISTIAFLFLVLGDLTKIGALVALLAWLGEYSIWVDSVWKVLQPNVVMEYSITESSAISSSCVIPGILEESMSVNSFEQWYCSSFSRTRHVNIHFSKWQDWKLDGDIIMIHIRGV